MSQMKELIETGLQAVPENRSRFVFHGKRILIVLKYLEGANPWSSCGDEDSF